MIVYSLPDGHVLQTIPIGGASAATLSDDGSFIAVASFSGYHVDLFEVDIGKPLGGWNLTWGNNNEAASLAFMHESNVLAIGTVNGKVELHPFRP